MKKFFNKHWDLIAVIAWFVLVFLIATLTSCSNTDTKYSEVRVKHKVKSVKRIQTPGVWPIDPQYEVVLENGHTFKTTNRAILNQDSVEYIYVSKSIKHDTIYSEK